jgi:hypothetical protein
VPRAFWPDRDFPRAIPVIVIEMTRLRVVLLSAGLTGLSFLAASAAAAQWVRLQRCSGAIPCSIPFGVRYAPDPLIASQYGLASPTAVSAHVLLEKKPTVELDTSNLSIDFAQEAARRFVLAHPPPASPAPSPGPSPKRGD